jgi:dolichol-phosphate mannosyltransferase
MNNDKESISIIIPSYREGDNLEIIIPKIIKILKEITNNYEILIIDTLNPLDNTKEIADKYKVKYINREKDNTYGSAIKTGIKFATGKFIIIMDADGSHPPEMIKNLWEYRNEYDIVIASRYVEEGQTENKLILILLSKILNIIYSLVLNIKCKDISNSFRLYKSEYLKKINLISSNFEIVEEILYKLIKTFSDIKIKEVPFTFKKRIYGKSKRNLISFAISYIYILIKLKLMK